MKNGFQQRLLEALRTHLVLGRVSNLPTVWSNCLAAWALVAGVFVPSLGLMTLGITLIYIGGMYLNDALDAPWDLAHGKERPIPRGEISQTSVLVLAVAYLLVGLVVIWGEGWWPFGSASLLVALVVVYNLYHKKIGWSPFIIAAARGMVYVTVASAAATRVTGVLVLWAFALAGYVVGLSYVAKVEQTNILKRYVPLLLMFVPPFLNSYKSSGRLPILLTGAFLGWLAYALVFVFTPKIRNLKRAVGAMLAGICLVDLLAVSQIETPGLWQGLCVALFVVALLFQRYVPAT